MSGHFREERKQRRIEEAEVRRNEREKLGDKDQLEKLIKAGHGNCKEAKRLLKKLNIPHGWEKI